MLKRLIAWVLTLVLVLSVMPLGVLAEGEPVIPAAHSHSATQHDCEHCDEAVTWEAWTQTNALPTTGGHYYLTDNVAITARTTIKGTENVVICLNGYNIDASKKDLAFYLQDTAKLTISDCTAYTDDAGVFHAGKITGGKSNGSFASAIFVKNGASVAMYNCIVAENVHTKNDKTAEGYGGAVQVRADTSANCTGYFKNVLFENNTHERDGGALNVYGAKASVVAEDCTFRKNTAVQGGAVYVKTGTVTLKNCLIEGNTSTGASGGAVRLNAATATLEGCTLKDNVAKNSGGSAVHTGGKNCNLTLKDCTFTGNTHTQKNADYHGAVYTTNDSEKIFLQGKIVFEGNYKLDASGNQVETAIYQQNTPNPVDVGGLTEGSKLSIHTRNKVETSATMVTAATAPTAWDHQWITYENSGDLIDYNITDGFIFYVAPVLPPVPDHVHCECGKTDCTETGHQAVEYTFWNDATTLPASGNYCLNTDVEVSGETSISGDLNLCLHGKKITTTATKRFYSTPKNLDALITISDCTATATDGVYTAGSFSGGVDKGTNAGGGAIYIRAGGELRIYDGIFAKNTTDLGGGAIMMAAGTKLTFTRGLVENNTAITDAGAYKAGGGIFMAAGSEAVISDVTFRGNQASAGGAIYFTNGGKLTATNLTIVENEALGSNAGAIYSKAADVTIIGGNFTGNTSKSDGGAVYVRDAKLDISGAVFSENESTAAGGALCYGTGSSGSITGATIEKNKAGSGGAMIIQGGAQVTISDTAVKENTAKTQAGGIYLYNAKLHLTGGEISGNTAVTKGGGILVAENAQITVSGAPTVIGNVAGEKANNLQLAGEGKIVLGAVSADAKVGVTVETLFRTISTETDTDCSASFISDAANMQIVYRDNALYMDTSSDHKHCVCAGLSAKGCTHEILTFAEWTDPTSLPASGNWCLTTDVTITNRADVYTTLNLCLNGHTVTANGKENAGTDQHFKVMDQGTLSITDCSANPGKLTGGTYGAVLFNYATAGGTFNLYNGILTGNEGNDSGGAVMVQCGKTEGNTFNMYGGKITGNTEHAFVKNGEVVGGNGGGVRVLRSTFNMYGGEITGNHAVAMEQDGKLTGGKGGAISADSASTVNLYGGIISGNTSDHDGGAVYATGNGTQVKLAGTTIQKNVSGNAGGGVLVAGRTHLEYKSGKITGNQANGTGGGGIFVSTNSTMNMTGGTVSGNVATKEGGGIYLYRATGNITGGTISGNKANNGGGIHLSGATLDLKDTTISSNTAAKNGGAIRGARVVLNADESAVTKLTIHSGTIKNNTAPIGAGVELEGVGGHMSLLGGKISGNKGENGGAIWISTKCSFTMEGGVVTGNSATKSGGGIVIYKATADFNGGEVTKNKATTSAGGLYINQEGTLATLNGTTVSGNSSKNGGGILITNKAHLEMKNGKVSGNTASATGAGIYVSTKSTFKMTGGSVAGNAAKSTGGGVYCLRSTATFAGGSVSGNSAKDGGGINSAGATLYLRGTAIYNNTAANSGGGVKTGNTVATVNGVKTTFVPKVVMSGSTISGNKAKNGGGMILAGAAGTMLMTGGQFTNNTATSAAGGIYVSTKTTFTMTGGSVHDNRCEGNGGGIYHLKSTGKYENVELYNNSAKTSGGALYFSGTATGELINVKLYDNKGDKGCGGAVYMNNDVPATFTGCQFYNNSVGTYGGAVYTAPGGNATLIKCELKDNVAELNGGALCARDAGNLIECVLTGNKAENGAAIHGGDREYTIVCNGWATVHKGNVVNVTDCVIQGNHATANGGGIVANYSCNTNITGCTFSDNTAGGQGSAIWATEDTTMQNLKVTGNVAANNGYAVYLNESEYDGHSYYNGIMQMAGDMIVEENEGGDMYLGEKTTVNILPDGLGQNTKIKLTLDSGLLTQRVYGAYNYEGESCVYTITYGDRSLTDPEYDPNMVTVSGNVNGENQVAIQDVLLYVGIGVVALAAIAGAALLIAKKKKSAGAVNK